MTSVWQIAVGAALGAGLGYGGARIAPRWMESRMRPWEAYVLAAVNGLLTGLLAAGWPLNQGYFWQHVIFISILTTASLVDLHDRIIPNELVLVGLVAGLALLFAAPYPDKGWISGLAGTGVGFGCLLLLAVIARGGMGMGDVKLSAVIGLFLGLKMVLMGLMLAFLAGGLISGILLLARIVGRKDHIPFGPWLALGAIITVLYGQQLLNWYLHY